ncbi:PucR family transcriptional regulator [Thermanaeromonas sp. C210]|uniref:PucR family transcriptional regulator n=1 Tax=Thermanaeromonas sp. C210 TaxID=2731925 RepID=UPI00155B6614|nr:PucR family transcriptional regulator [Thermanaeromonas sp. C210]GFN22347.1 CdaR family transcriptional regulator [Thermanaeromonas sp. C210]
MDALYGFSVEYALTLDCFYGAKVVGGREGLNRIITSVNVMEVPDVLPWVKEGQLLLTTGFSIKDDPVAQEQLIPELAKRGLAALAVKPKRYLDVIPVAMIDAANEHAIPLIELPPDASHPKLLQGIYTELVNRQTSLLKKTVEAHEQIMAVLLEGGGLREVAGALSRLVSNPAIIFDADGKILATSPNVPPLIHSNRCLKLADNNSKKWRMKRETLITGDKKVCQVICPVVHGSTLFGYIAVLEENRPLREIDLISIEQASTLAALVLLNREAVKGVETKYRNELLYDWIQGDIQSLDELLERAAPVGWDLEDSFNLLLIGIDKYEQVLSGSSKANNTALIKLKEQLRRTIVNVMEQNHEFYILGERGHHFILLVRVKATWSNRAIKEKMHKVASNLQQGLRQSAPKITCSIGIGRFYPNLLDMKQSYLEARRAMEIGRIVKGDGQVTHFDDLGIYRLLCQGTQEEMRRFLEETFLPLQDYDRAHHTELIPTLEMFFKCNGNISKVAREMFAHYNTVVYRLEKIQEITGINLDDPEQRLNLQVALKIAQMEAYSS